MLRTTTDFVYLRMHGPDHHHLYSGSYPDADLTWWGDRIREWNLADHDAFVYFNKDGNANALGNARTLRALLRPEVSAIRLRPRSTRASVPGFVP
jgi:uncharacterized protein YecE (DUF72 family)